MTMTTLADLLPTAAARFGPRTAITLAYEHTSETWSYSDLYLYARRVAQLLQGRGVAPGDRIAFWAPNGPRWVGAFFGCMFAGAVVVPIDVKVPLDFIRKVAAQTEPRFVLAPQVVEGDLATLGLSPLFVEGLDAALPPDDPQWQPTPIGPDDMAELVYTSGTTGAPKGVMLSHANILSDLDAASRQLGDLQKLYIERKPDVTFRMLSLLPLSHMFEQICEMFYVLSLGAAITYVDSLQPSTIFRAMRENPITGIPVVPQVLTLFMNGLEREVRKKGQWQSWERANRVAPYLPLALRRRLFREIHDRLGGALDFFVCGGAYLDPQLAQRWENLGIKVVVGYGMTEASPVVSFNSLAERNLRSVGKPIACNEVRIATDGEILVRGPNITRGYWHNPQATQEAYEDGWYRTGDLGFLDKKGYLYLRGRKKNMIVLANGMNVYPEDIENALTQESAVSDAVVVGRASGSEVELHAILLLQDGADPTAIVKAVNRRLAAHQRLKGHVVWHDEDFPRTHTLKPKRDEMLRVLAERGERIALAP